MGSPEEMDRPSSPIASSPTEEANGPPPKYDRVLVNACKQISPMAPFLLS
jgi:hypothetical protein